MSTPSELLRNGIRDVQDFPKPGIVFKDISPILSDPDLLRLSVAQLTATAGDVKIDKVVGIDARGFIFAAPVALDLNALMAHEQGQAAGAGSGVIGIEFHGEYCPWWREISPLMVGATGV